MAISRAEVQALIEREGKPGSSILSVYLDVDQSQAANLNRGYVAALKDRLRSLEHQVRAEAAEPGAATGGSGTAAAASREPQADRARAFAADCERVLQWVSNHDVRGRGLALFCDTSENFWWECRLQIPLQTQVRWEERPYVRPLVEALDEYERFGIVLANREKARLFLVHLGEIEEDREVSAPEKRKHIASPGSDSALSQTNLQRREDERSLRHLKQVADDLERLSAKYEFDRLVLAGPQEITRELSGVLSKRLKSLVVKTLALPIDANEQTVLKETLRVEEEVERAREAALVEELITRAAKKAQAAISLEATLEAMRLGRIMELVYVHGYAVAGVQCMNCRSLFVDGIRTCSYCGAGVQAVPDVVARLVDLVVDSGGQAESVRGGAAERLKTVGNIGAMLRF